MRLFLSATLLVFAILSAPNSYAAVNRSVSPNRPGGSGPLGLGIMLGDPSGISLKYWNSSTTAVALGVASSWRDYLEIFVDHDWHFLSVFTGNSPLVPYVGVGAGLLFDTYDRYSNDYYTNRRSIFLDDNSGSFALSFRIPLGIEFLPRAVPLGAFIELMPGLIFLPGMHGIVQAAVGARYYF